MRQCGYRLIDGEQRNAEHPGSFWIPPLCARLKVAVGDIVKVGFETMTDRQAKREGFGGERLWVKVTGVGDSGEFVGEIDNEPLLSRLYLGQKVKFQRRHVIDIFVPEKLAAQAVH